RLRQTEGDVRNRLIGQTGFPGGHGTGHAVVGVAHGGVQFEIFEQGHHRFHIGFGYLYLTGGDLVVTVLPTVLVFVIDVAVDAFLTPLETGGDTDRTGPTLDVVGRDVEGEYVLLHFLLAARTAENVILGLFAHHADTEDVERFAAVARIDECGTAHGLAGDRITDHVDGVVEGGEAPGFGHVFIGVGAALLVVGIPGEAEVGEVEIAVGTDHEARGFTEVVAAGSGDVGPGTTNLEAGQTLLDHSIAHRLRNEGVFDRDRAHA